MYLNKVKHLKEAVRRLSEGFDAFGVERTLHRHRGGSSGFHNPGSDERDFAKRIKQAAGDLKKNPARRKNGDRVASNIKYR